MSKKVKGKQWIIDISSVYDQDERLIKVLDNNSRLQKKWLHKMVDRGWIEIVQFYNEEQEITSLCGGYKEENHG